MRIRLLDRLFIYERLLQEVTIYLTSGGTFKGTVAKVHRDFVTLTTISGAIDIPFSSILAIAPAIKKNRKGKG
ncbi:hypothetical protein TEPIDINF_001352 [Tepidibacillus infernus]|uniref:LSM domain-containing protein n=1 Tax=Tepidibacillus decaturensis TaxID=1413211 RepID=A0A135L4P2_9BACI|nr:MULTISPECIES: hypothetical protein [Tepidibacillus]KXG43899.1 hypothetical protein U473_07685 [Tepidibacillus decaturensis]GBF12328.1 hypothetical protein HK1_02389 [Tepidibacillus sp. HK-1]